MRTQEIVIADVLVSSHIDNLLLNINKWTQQVRRRRQKAMITHRLWDMDSTDRLIGDDQLDHRQGVEHSDCSNVPAQRKKTLYIYKLLLYI